MATPAARHDDYEDEELEGEVLEPARPQRRRRRDDEADFEFSVKKRNQTPIRFRLGGLTGSGERDDHLYVFTPPKQAVMLDPMLAGASHGEMLGMEITKASFDWLGMGLSEDDNRRIIERLRDPDDDLDAPDLEGIMAAISEKMTKRPTS